MEKHSSSSSQGLAHSEQQLAAHQKPYLHFQDQHTHEGYQGSFQSCFHYGDNYRIFKKSTQHSFKHYIFIDINFK
ncbi:UNVERIFIED_CONTAM: hypothetical protein FKN15_062945 [Acipenser sinensis]